MAQLTLKIEKKVTRASKLKKRMKAIKPILSELGWQRCTDILIAYYPEYNTLHFAVTIKNVWDVKGSDKQLTEIFEDIAKGSLTL